MSLDKITCDSKGTSEAPLGKRNKKPSYHDIAEALLEDRLLLTALELHNELVEAGKELKLLRDFFSNPGNFEANTQETATRLSRSGSQATLDSLDLTRYSEDGAVGDERVAVLEFELRKAKDTISALRNNLTSAVESETSTPNKGSLRNVSYTTIKLYEQKALNFLINEYLLLQGYKLTSITFADENQNQDFDDWDDVGLNISKPPELIHLYREGLKQSGQNGVTVTTQTDQIQENKDDIILEQSLELEKLKSKLYFLEADLSDLRVFKEQSERNEDDSPIKDEFKNSTLKNVESPERFEIIDKNMVVFKRNSIDGDNISNNSFNTGDWAKVDIPKTQETFCDKEREFKDLSVEAYAKEVHNLCDVETDSSVENEVFSIIRSKNVELDNVVHIVTQSLLKIIPNVILNKREEVIPLLMAAVYLNPKATERDKLLQQLFHLKKRPSASERMTILSGVIGIAKNTGEQMVENEILPQCWLQLTHKHVERRLLVAEACTLLIPYVSSPIRNSLILSMLQQMLEDKEEIVRVQIVKALALLFCYCQDIDKYAQCELLALNTLNDSSNLVFNAAAQILFPVLAKWAFQVGYLSSSLLQKLLHKLNDYIKKLESHVKVSQEVDGICRILTVIDYLLPFLLTAMAYYEDVTSNIEKEVVISLRPDFSALYCGSLVNPENFIKSDLYVGTVLHEFDKYISDNPNVSWAVMDWMIDEMIPDLLNNLNHIELSQHSVLDGFLNLFAHISIAFGPSFTKYKMRPIIQKKIQNLEQVISSFNQFCPSLNAIPIYVTVLRLGEDFDEISSVLKKFLCALPLCGSPLDCLEVTIRKLCESGLQDLVVDSLWSGVVHQRPLVKVAAANLFYSIIGFCNEELLKLKVIGAIVTLASDSDCLVRTATIPVLGRLITNCGPKEIHDKAYMQLQTFANDVSLKENHTFSRQLVVTFGNIFVSSGSTFRNDVILPELIDFSNFILQMTNQTRKVDMCLALLEAFTHVVYSPLNNQSISALTKNALRNLEVVISENASLAVHHETVVSMIKECDNKTNQCAPDSPVAKTSKLGQNVNQGVEEMKQRVTKIFNKPGMTKSNTLSNLPGIFKKK